MMRLFTILISVGWIVSSHSFRCAIQKNARLASRFPLAMTNLDQTKVDVSYMQIKEGPGETRDAPMSSVQRSRLEVAKNLVTFIIAFLALKMKVDEVFNQYFPKQEWKEGEEVGPVQLLEGSKIRIQEWSRGTVLPNPTDALRYDVKVIYNGVEIKTFNNGNRIIKVDRSHANDGKSIWEGLSLSGLNEDNVLKNMKYGARRKILLPAAYAFQEVGYPPYIPGDADVLVDVILLPPDNP